LGTHPSPPDELRANALSVEQPRDEAPDGAVVDQPVGRVTEPGSVATIVEDIRRDLDRPAANSPGTVPGRSSLKRGQNVDTERRPRAAEARARSAYIAPATMRSSGAGFVGAGVIGGRYRTVNAVVALIVPDGTVVRAGLTAAGASFGVQQQR
jgi:hypothetical protein